MSVSMYVCVCLVIVLSLFVLVDELFYFTTHPRGSPAVGLSRPGGRVRPEDPWRPYDEVLPSPESERVDGDPVGTNFRFFGEVIINDRQETGQTSDEQPS